MKTIKNSISMRAILSTVFAISVAAFVNGQGFQTPDPNVPNTQALEEVRLDSTVEYSLVGTHNAGEQYRWEVTGGTITSTAAGTISGGTSVDFAADAHTITVQWDQAPGAIAAVNGQIQVQKESGNGCPSQIQILNVNVWNNATATLTTGTENICSGAAPSVTTISVALTGAPDNGTEEGFAVDYSFTVPTGLAALDGDGNSVATTGTEITNGNSVNITLPEALVNSTDGDLDFEVTLTGMNDDFEGDGTVSGTYTITVNPVPETGEIQSDFSLTRRME